MSVKTKSGTYRIIRFYFNEDEPSRVIYRGLTEQEAKDHCNNPETSSSTAKCARAARITAEHGEWFDGFTDHAET